MTPTHHNWLTSLFLLITRAKSGISVSQWNERHVHFKEPECVGAFSLSGREYLREVMDNWSDDSVTDQVLVFGTRCGKTRSLYGGLAWTLGNSSVRALYVKPKSKGAAGAEDDARTRFIPMLRASKELAKMIPSGARRNDFKTAQQIIGGSIVDWVGSNSVSALASNPCRVVIQDEVDKFNTTRKRDADGNVVEADASALADERCKEFSNPKRFKASTPTLENGIIWQELMKSDIRRYFVPCPHCSKRMVFAWSQQFTVLPLKDLDGNQIPLGFVFWDKDARHKDGSWDYNRVESSAHVRCPHCSGKILDTHKAEMVREGEWRPTQRGVPGYRGYHLPSMYAAHAQCNFGKMAVRFLKGFESNDGTRGFVNSDLAEVNSGQERSNTIQVSAQKIAGADWHTLMTVDFQKLWPFLWFLVQKWSSFKLLQPLPMLNGRPQIDFNAKPELKTLCDKIADGKDAAWLAVAELLRFDTRTGNFPLLEWCASNCTGENLIRLHRDVCRLNTMDLGRHVYRELGQRMPRGGDSEIIAAGHCELSGDDAWHELRDVQTQFHVGETLTRAGISANNGVLIDSGYAEEHNPEVLRKCFESGQSGRFEFYDPLSKKFIAHRIHQYVRPVPVDGWLPFKGYPIAKRWRKDGMEKEWHFAPDDPFKGTSEADKFTLAVLEAASDLYFHRWMDSRDRQPEIRKAMAANKSYRGNIWSIAPDIELFPKERFTMEQFNAQMNARYRVDGEIKERGTGGSGKRRHPDHLNDCARNQYPLAECHGIFSYETNNQKDK